MRDKSLSVHLSYCRQSGEVPLDREQYQQVHNGSSSGSVEKLFLHTESEGAKWQDMLISARVRFLARLLRI